MDKCRLLWISTCTPVSGLRHAGGVNFKHDFDNISRDPRFDVTIISISDDGQKEKTEKELDWVKHNVIYLEHSLKSKFQKLANLESRYNIWNRNACLISNYCEKRILDICKELKLVQHYNPEVIILEYTGCVVLAPELKKIFPDARYVAKEHDVTYIGYERKKDYYKGFKGWVWNEKYKHEKKVELNALRECNVIVPHNPHNFDVLLSDGIRREQLYWYVPYYQDLSDCKRKSNQKDILFYGAMARPENYLSCIWFIEKVMPLIEDLDIRFVILGSNPPESLQKYESDRIHITGFVEDIKPFFENSMCLVAPLVLGAGIKIKILEALSSGLVVLTNDLGIEGIEAVSEKEYIHCTTEDEYGDWIRKIGNGLVDCTQMGKRAKELVQKQYNVESSFEKYKNKLLSVLKDYE